MSATRKLVKAYAPHGDRIVVRPDKPEEKAKTDGLLVLPEVYQESKQFGTVVAVAQELADTNKYAPSVGDRVLWGDCMGIDLKQISADDVVVLRYPGEVLATIRYVETDLTAEEMKEQADAEEAAAVTAQARKELGINR